MPQDSTGESRRGSHRLYKWKEITQCNRAKLDVREADMRFRYETCKQQQGAPAKSLEKRSEGAGGPRPRRKRMTERKTKSKVRQAGGGGAGGLHTGVLDFGCSPEHFRRALGGVAHVGRRSQIKDISSRDGNRRGRGGEVGG